MQEVKSKSYSSLPSLRLPLIKSRRVSPRSLFYIVVKRKGSRSNIDGGSADLKSCSRTLIGRNRKSWKCSDTSIFFLSADNLNSACHIFPCIKVKIGTLDRTSRITHGLNRPGDVYGERRQGNSGICKHYTACLLSTCG